MDPGAWGGQGEEEVVTRTEDLGRRGVLARKPSARWHSQGHFDS
jgi:hypothetical protein